MNTQELIPAAVIKLTKQLKITGWWFMILGSILCFFAVPPVFDPHATVMFKGVPADDFITKLVPAIFVSSSTVMEYFFSFVPRRMQKKLAVISRFINAGL